MINLKEFPPSCRRVLGIGGMKLIRPNYSILNQVFSDKILASESEICWREFLVANNSFINYCSQRVKENEISDILKSLQIWTTKREYLEYRQYNTADRKWEEVIPNLGDIIFADFGINFSNEISYAHPAVVLENIGKSIFVVPCSSSADKITEAYHPIDNKNSKSLYRKVLKENGFDDICVLEIDKCRVINKSRIIRIQGHLNENINDENSLFNEIKKKIYEVYLPKQNIKHLKLLKLNEALIQENQSLKDRILDLEIEIKKLQLSDSGDCG